jgi:hypothetical protein
MIGPGEVLVATVFVTGVVVTIRTIGGFVYRSKELELKAQQGSMGVDDARLQRIENAVETIALEVERISENQRYTTKLLNERLEKSNHLAAG